MSGLTSTPILAGSMMICVLILGGVLILLAGYGLFPSKDLYFILLLLAFLAASMLVIALAETVRNYCCRGSDAQNLHPDLRARRDVLNDTKSRARWFKSGCCKTARPKKETPREKEQFESEANLNGAPSLAAHKALVQPHMFDLNSAWPHEHPKSEVVAEVLPEMAEGAAAEVHLDAAGGGPRVQVFVGDDYGDYCQIEIAEVMNGDDGVGVLDSPDLPNESVEVTIDVAEKPPSRALQGLGPVLGYKRSNKSQIPSEYT